MSDRPEYKAAWYQKNKERLRERGRERMRKVRAERPEWYEKLYERSKEKLRDAKRAVVAKLVEHYGGACKICGLEDAPCIYDFHHLNPKEKEMGVSAMVARFHQKWERLVREADKCLLVCSNCHRKIHRGLVEPNDFSEKSA